jgi:S-ribosylhomocysteine lyase
MGCQTGFYLLLRDNITRKEALELTRDALRFIMDFNGEIPGSKRRECGNYLEHDLAGAKIAAADMYRILTSWNETNMIYEGVNDDE